jgi:site-specific recombinase XerD
MKPHRPNELAVVLHDYFTDHLPRLRGMSPHTIHSYRDSLSLLLCYLETAKKRSIVNIDIDDITDENVIAFLQHLEQQRGNGSATRNVRLAAIHAFFTYIAHRYPQRLQQCQCILGVPFKRTITRQVEYLEYDEIQSVLNVINRNTADGRRDYVLLVIMFNTGARVQEILDLRPCDLQLVKPFHARLLGKGRKERLCPLWPQTAQLLQQHLSEAGVEPRSNGKLFLNHRKESLTRFGVRYILAKYLDRAKAETPSLISKRLHPHSMRHSTAVHLLQSGVDIVTISQWLGHASVTTTNIYATVDLDMKRKAINKVDPVGSLKSSAALWKSDLSVLEWLKSL